MGMGEMHRHRLIATPRITNRIDRQIQLTPFLRLVKASKEHFACCFACSNWDEYDWSVFNAARSYQNHTQEIAAPSFEQGEEAYSPLMNKYQEAISITEHYRETKSRFTWIGKIEDERLLSALENLSDADLELITLYAYEEYDTVEISKVFGTTKQNISKKIRRITNFIKNFQIEVV